MNYLGRFIDNFRYVYKEINAATLTGAIDVIVVEQPDGTYTCSPFHVRFGKIGVLRSREKIVEIEINGEPINIYMKLGESGEAFFVEGILDDDDGTIPEHLVCSPILQNLTDAVASNSEKEDFEEDGADENAGANDVEQQPNQRKTPKMFHAITVSECENISHSGFRPIQSVSDNDAMAHSSSEVEQFLKVNSYNNVATLDGARSVPCTVKRKRKRKLLQYKKMSESRRGSDALDDTLQVGEGLSRASSSESDDEKNVAKEIARVKESDAVDEGLTFVAADHRNSVPSDLHFFSDTEVTCSSGPHNMRPFTPVQSDTEFEFNCRQNECANSTISDSQSSSLNQHTWKWGELPSTAVSKSDAVDMSPDSASQNLEESKRSLLADMLGFMKTRKHIRQKSADGIYLSELDTQDLDPEIARLYLQKSNAPDYYEKNDENAYSYNDDVESGNGPSLAQSPSSIVGAPAGPVYSEGIDAQNVMPNAEIAISLCGNPTGEANWEETFTKQMITFEQFVNDPSIYKNPNLIFRIGKKMCRWETACPQILSYALYNKPLPEEVINRLEENEKLALSKSSSTGEDGKRGYYRRGYYSWFNWARNTQHKSTEEKPSVGTDGTKIDTIKEDSVTVVVNDAQTLSDQADAIGPADAELIIISSQHSSSFPKDLNVTSESRNRNDSTDSDMELKLNREPKIEKYRKTLRLTSEQISSLNLNVGRNEVVFSVTTAYQGTTSCSCTLFLWRYDDKIVVSDIDGTITRSDVLGHIMPIVGNDWAQSGVAKLFNRIESNGYNLLYLSARAIGQSKGTRKYLNSIRQEDLTLPDGPLLLNPTSLLSAFHREVIEKKPEEFKIACLRDIEALFPFGSKPFYAGYGNKINDVWTYQAVGIPITRIFTINHRGELKHELTETFQSSYISMYQIADQMFPVKCKQNLVEEFSEFNYWRDPIPELDDVM